VFCHQCGHRNPEGAHFCSACGSPLEHPVREDATIVFHPNEERGEAADEVEVPLDDLDRAGGMLVVRHGPNAGSTYVLDQLVTRAGRHPDSEIFLDDVTVSRRHAEIRHTPGDVYTVKDVGSLNGTYVNRNRVEEAVLSTGDELQIGRFRLVFLSLSPSAAGGR
jgi:hypothetical protein